MIVEYRPRGLLLDAEDPDELDDLDDLGDLYRSSRWYRAESFHPERGAVSVVRPGDVIGACVLVFLVAPLFGASVVVALAHPTLTPLLLVTTAMAGITLCVAGAGRLFGGAVDPSCAPVSYRRPGRGYSRVRSARRRAAADRRAWAEATGTTAVDHQHTGWYRARADILRDQAIGPRPPHPSRFGPNRHRSR